MKVGDTVRYVPNAKTHKARAMGLAGFIGIITSGPNRGGEYVAVSESRKQMVRDLPKYFVQANEEGE